MASVRVASRNLAELCLRIGLGFQLPSSGDTIWRYELLSHHIGVGDFVRASSDRPRVHDLALRGEGGLRYGTDS